MSEITKNPEFDKGSPGHGKFSGFEECSGCMKSQLARFGRCTILEVTGSI